MTGVDNGDNGETSNTSLQRIGALEAGLQTLSASMQALTQVVMEIKDSLIQQPPRALVPNSQDPGTNRESNAPPHIPTMADNHTLPRPSAPPVSEGVHEALRELWARFDAKDKWEALQKLGIQQPYSPEWNNVVYPPKYKPQSLTPFDGKEFFLDF